MPAINSVSFSNQLAVLVELCQECARACAACANAFSASGLTDTFRDGERVCSDCADICRSTAQVASRYSGGDAKAFEALLRACAKACAECAAECGKHGIEAAAPCVSAALLCKRGCEQVADALRWR